MTLIYLTNAVSAAVFTACNFPTKTNVCWGFYFSIQFQIIVCLLSWDKHLST